MNTVQAHRGPDDLGQYADPQGRICLGARRLSIIDIEGGHQPISNEDGTVWAVLNGEIYNSPALQERLRMRGHRFTSRADTETLVHLYEEYEDALVHALEGMFAFAIWDQRRGRLLLARDRFGEKPLFVRRLPSGLAFASELSALRAAAEHTPELDPDAIDTFLVLGYVPGPHTICKGIEQLAPGHLLSWEERSGSIASESYWAARRSVRAGKEPERELSAETLRLLDRAVKGTLVSDVPVGIFLSGGIDSALVAALAVASSSRSPLSFTVGYDIGDVSELDRARSTARLLGTRHHEVVLRQQDVSSRVRSVLGRLDQPLADPAVIPLHAVAELARQHVSVVIGGEGADELFGGYPRYRWLIRSIQIKRALPEYLARRAAWVLSSPGLGHQASRMADVVVPQTTLDRHLDWVTARRRYVRAEMYGPRLAGLTTSESALSSLVPHTEGFGEELGADAFMQLDQRHWLPDDVLFKGDRAGMLNSLEVRTPYLSREVSEFANSVRAATHLGGGGKKLLRDALADFVPKEKSRGRKLAFRVPGGEWLRGPLRTVLEDQVASGYMVSEGFIEREFLRRSLNEHVSGSDRTGVLWPLLALGIWLDAYLGRSTPA